jgi:cytochrome c oxidase cbb3-type subunit 3
METQESMAWNWRVRISLVFALCLASGVGASAQDEKGSSRGAQIFDRSCSGCHGADGKGSDRGPAIATMPRTIARSDADLIDIVQNGIAGKGMPPFPGLGEQGTKGVVQYLRSLQGVTNAAPAALAKGNAQAGRLLYFGKGQCARCHIINGEGGFIASDMTTYGQSRRPEDILKAIVHPDTQVAPESRVVAIRSKPGETLMGVLRSEDNMNLALQTEDGRYHLLKRSSLAEVKYTDHSLMPHDYGTKFSTSELDDVVAFLIMTGKSAPVEAAPTGRGRHGGN